MGCADLVRLVGWPRDIAPGSRRTPSWYQELTARADAEATSGIRPSLLN
jgi:hypothetical protein